MFAIADKCTSIQHLHFTISTTHKRKLLVTGTSNLYVTRPTVVTVTRGFRSNTQWREYPRFSVPHAENASNNAEWSRIYRKYTNSQKAMTIKDCWNTNVLNSRRQRRQSRHPSKFVAQQISRFFGWQSEPLPDWPILT